MKKIATILTILAVSLSAGSFTLTDNVKVTKTKPAYRTITKRVPYQQCWEETVPVRRYNNNYSNYSNPNDPIGALIGGVAGGILGHQIGGGRGKTVATVGGAIIGTMVGHNLSSRGSHRNRKNSYTSYETKQRCSTKYESSDEQQFIGYKNIGRYKGQKIIRISQNRLRYIPIRITINY